MLPVRPRRLCLTVAVALLVAPLSLSGCRRSAVSSFQLPPLAVGEVSRRALLTEAASANVVICVLDAARADHFGCYGYERDTTPVVDELAEESVVFRNHFSTCSATQPSTASLFTGLYPDAHLSQPHQGLDPGVFTLAQGLRAVAVPSLLFTSNLVASPETGLDAGLEQVFPPSGKRSSTGEPAGEVWRTPEGLTRGFAKWLKRRPKGRFLAYLHFLPPHTPYDAPPDFVTAVTKRPLPPIARFGYPFPEAAPSYFFRGGRLGASPDLYDANLRWADWGVGEVVRLLRQRGLLDKTLLIVTADHGEAFGEHGYVFHALAVYDELVHIPLVMRFPGKQRLVGEVTALTQTVDLLPTVCDLYQAPYPKEVQGRSLLPLLDGEKSAVRDHVFAVARGPGENWPSYVVRNSQWALFLYRGGTLRALYDLPRDPAQGGNVIGEHPDAAAEMVTAFKAFARTQKRSLDEFLSPQAAAAQPEPARRPMSDKARRELKALGYLD
jgi:arylsulfatase A-like enzyme